MLTENEKKVLRYIALHSKEIPSINKVSKACKITPNGAYKILKKFEEEGILKFNKISNIKSYYTDFKNDRTANFMELALTPKSLKTKIKYRAEDLKQIKNITTACVLFGSYISDKQNPNDLDVLFVFDKKNHEQYKEKINRIKEISPIKIHDIIQTKKDLAQNMKEENKVIIKIIEEGIVLWGQNALCKIIKMSTKDKIKKCFKEGETDGERHKGLRRIEISEEKISSHIEKANRNFHAITSFREIGFSDWSASAAFYSLYHLLLALLAKNGVESRNQNCTFEFIKNLIDEGKLSLSRADLEEIFDKRIKEDLEHSNKIFDLRENILYSTRTSMEDKEFEDMKKRVKDLFDKIKKDVEAE